jgi:spore coat protein U-like protein
MMKNFIRLIAAGALLTLGLPLTAQAQVNVNVQVQVNGTCSVSGPPVNANFGAQAPTALTNLTAPGSVTLTCNRGALPLVSVGPGNNFSGTRRMSNGAVLPATPAYVGYAIKQPTISGANDFTVCPSFGGGVPFGTGADRLSASAAFSGSGGPRTVSLCFETTVDENTPVATYTDTVAVSVTF